MQYLAFLVLLPNAALSSSAPTLKLGKTTLVGQNMALLNQDFFGGIPYAEPPLGQLRLKPPILKTDLDVETFDASNFGPACLQTGTINQSEDCLSINIFRPSDISPKEKLPILFWTYGGGFDAGASLLYNGSAIVAQSMIRGTPLIYVNFNYRLGLLGFPQGREAEKEKALNLALMDQLAALSWVHQNIEIFGGDKNKVTMFGGSAGAIMTAILFLNSPIDKLARAAIFESGSAASSHNTKADRREIDWQHFVSAVPSCASLALTQNTFDCLRQVNSSEISQGLNFALASAPELVPFVPTFDGPGGLYPELPSRIFDRGSFAKLPFITGTNLDEGTAFISRTIDSIDAVREYIVANFTPAFVPQDVFEKAVDKLFVLYPNDPSLGSPFNTGNETFGLNPVYKLASALEGDVIFQSQRRLWIQAASRAGVKTYGYLFTQLQPGADPADGVLHGAEVDFVYGKVQSPPDSLNLSRIMIDYWISFATCLDPNDGKGISRPYWPHYTPENEVLMQLNGLNQTAIPDDYRKQQIDFINAFPAVWNH